MSAYTVELVGSREGTQGQDPSLILRYLVRGTDDDFMVRALANSTSPDTYDSLVKKQIHTIQEATEWWLADIEYGARPVGIPGTGEWSFEIGGGATIHVDHSLETVNRYPDGSKPDYKQAIGVRRDGNGLAVDGLDIDLTTFRWSETHHLDYSLLTPAYVNTLYTLRGRVNDKAWRIFAKGEVLLDAITGAARGEWTVPITFSFAASHNVTGLTIGDITGIDKEGWQYLWIQFEDVEDNDTHLVLKRPKHVFVERMKEYGDFDLLGLPDPWT